MIRLEKPEIYGFNAAIRGMRNSWNSWDKSDSYNGANYIYQEDFESDKLTGIIGKNCDWELYKNNPRLYCAEFGSVLICNYIIGKNDLALMKKLCAAGSDHRKFLRMIVVTVDITAPLYFFKEFDTYKVGTVTNSCSTMHKIHDKEFTLYDFSHEHLCEGSLNLLKEVIDLLNTHRHYFNNFDNYKDELLIDKKAIWWQIIQLLPTSYNQKRTVMLNYEVLRNIYHARREHKLDEWKEFCKWIEALPYSELITGQNEAV